MVVTVISCVCVANVTMLLLSSYLIFSIVSKSKRHHGTSERAPRFKRVTHEELRRATDDFSPANLIGQGSHGHVYKEILQGNDAIAIKVFLRSPSQTSSWEKSFVRECQTLGQVRHRNLMKIATVCSSPDFKAIIMPLMPYTLQKLRHHRGVNGLPTSLNLKTRIRILGDMVSAVSYLHHDCNPGIVLGDIKPENVLLNEDMTASLSDFGVARFFMPDTSVSTSSTLKGSVGYIAPEYGTGARLSEKGDVYSFGVVVLEVITGMRPTDAMFRVHLTLPRWVSSALSERKGRLEDKRQGVEHLLECAGSTSTMEIQTEEEWKSFEGILRVGLICTSEDARRRPTIKEIQSMIYDVDSGVLRKPLQEHQIIFDIKPIRLGYYCATPELESS